MDFDAPRHWLLAEKSWNMYVAMVLDSLRLGLGRDSASALVCGSGIHRFIFSTSTLSFRH